MKNKVATVHKSQFKYLGIDAGGTFTDFVLLDNGTWHIHKVLSSPENPAHAILQGIEELGLNADIAKQNLYITHGSTVATNAALERKGARTAYIANKGMKDVLTIGRQARKELYNLNPKPSLPPVAEDLCLEVDCRRDAAGQVTKALEEKDLNTLMKKLATLKPDAIAINLLFSFLADDEERRIEQALSPYYFVSRSSNVLPKYKEYERGMATWLNASLGPKVQHYMLDLMAALNNCPTAIMQSSGGTMAIEHASTRAVNLLLSGPAGGLAAVNSIGKQCQETKLISFDMGGTSTDVALMNGKFELSDEGSINDWPVAIPMLSIDTIGAGGGSIAWADEGHMLHVGPQSAGSIPGPACYQKGGNKPTVTDANMVLGRLQADAFLGGSMRLNKSLAIKSIAILATELDMTVEALAKGIVLVAEQQMIRSLQGISVQKGHDPKEFVLCCFGGAGGMHVCALAEHMCMQKAIVPKNSGVLSALGMLTAPKQRHLTQTYLKNWNALQWPDLEKAFLSLETDELSSLKKELSQNEKVRVHRSFDLRFAGQGFTLNIPFSPEADQAFLALHKSKYGHTLEADIELVNINTALTVKSNICLPQYSEGNKKFKPSKWVVVLDEAEKVPVYPRDSLSEHAILVGPAIITELVSTTWLKRGWRLTLDRYGNLLLKQV